MASQKTGFSRGFRVFLFWSFTKTTKIKQSKIRIFSLSQAEVSKDEGVKRHYKLENLRVNSL